MSIKFKEVDHKKKHQKIINLTATIENSHSSLLIKVEDNILVAQADKYSEIGDVLLESFKMTWEEESIESIRTWIITETYLVIEIKLRED